MRSIAVEMDVDHGVSIVGRSMNVYWGAVLAMEDCADIGGEESVGYIECPKIIRRGIRIMLRGRNIGTYCITVIYEVYYYISQED
jgi:hypothetical protein